MSRASLHLRALHFSPRSLLPSCSGLLLRAPIAKPRAPSCCMAAGSTPRPAFGSLLPRPKPSCLPASGPYGEESRRYRRTIYRHNDWLAHRSETRLLRNLKGTFTSGVVRSLLSEVFAVCLVALFTILWNSILFGYTDFNNVAQPRVFFADIDGAPNFLKAQLPLRSSRCPRRRLASSSSFEPTPPTNAGWRRGSPGAELFRIAAILCAKPSCGLTTTIRPRRPLSSS